jgi:hypothetical protein
MHPQAAILGPALALLAGCAPPPAPISVDLAEAQCVRQVLNGGDTSTSLTLGVGGGFGGWGWDDGWSGTGVALSATLPPAPSRNPEADYDACVIRKSGQAPDTPLSERPEVKG